MTPMVEICRDLHSRGYLVYPLAVENRRRWVAALAHDGKRDLIQETGPLTRHQLELFRADAQRGDEGPWLRTRPVPT